MLSGIYSELRVLNQRRQCMEIMHAAVFLCFVHLQLLIMIDMVTENINI